MDINDATKMNIIEKKYLRDIPSFLLPLRSEHFTFVHRDKEFPMKDTIIRVSRTCGKAVGRKNTHECFLRG